MSFKGSKSQGFLVIFNNSIFFSIFLLLISYIRLGEETNDIEHTCNWGVDDMPSEIESFEPVVDVNDDNWGGYEKVDLDAE